MAFSRLVACAARSQRDRLGLAISVWDDLQQFPSNSPRPHLPANRPDEAGKFSGDRRDNNRWLLASGDHRAVSTAQPGLCLPGDITDLLGQSDEDLRLLLRNACRILVAPCCLDEHTPGLAVA